MEALRLHDAVIFLVAAGIVIPVVKRLRMSPVLGFLLIGLAIGPYGIGRLADEYAWLHWFLITDVEGVRGLAELGVVFLLFMVGLELSFERLWSLRRLVFGLGTAQILLTGAVIAVIAWWFGNPVGVAAVLGSCLALSSTAIVLQLLIEQGRFGTTVGRSSFAVLLAQDIAVVPILFFVGAFGGHTEGSLTWELAVALGGAFLVVAAILGIGRFAVRPLLRFVGKDDNPELFMAVTLLIIIGASTITHTAGLSAALGAFLAGLLLAESEYRYEVETDIEPFKGLLMGLFFMSVAMGIDLAEIFTNPLWILLSIIGLFAVKGTVAALVARAFGLRWGQAAELGLTLGQGGEFAFIVVSLALSYALLPESTAQFMLIVVGATMFLTPFTTRLARMLGAAMDRNASKDADDETDLAPDLSEHVVIVGYGRTGQLLAKLLSEHHIAHVALEINPEQVTKLLAQGAPVYLGDAGRVAMLDRMRWRHAAALVICVGNPAATERIIAAARQIDPAIPIIARAHDDEHAAGLLEQGATRVVPELLESGLQLGHIMLEEIGLPMNVARDMVEAHRVGLELAAGVGAGEEGDDGKQDDERIHSA